MIGNLGRRYWSARGYLRAHRSVRELGIRSTDLVVDLGSGQNPHPRANVLCDRFVFDNTERASHGALRVDRPVVVSDATKTPFADRAFDFAFCSHLLEHMDDPAALLDELQRIASAGYIETPGSVYEKLYGWRFHRWFVSVTEGRIRIEAKQRPIFDQELHDWFSNELEQPSFWRTFIPRLLERNLLTAYAWRGQIAYEVIGSADPDATGFTGADAGEDPASPDGDEPRGAQTLPQHVKGRIDAITRRRSDRRVSEIFERLRCPSCGKTLRLSPNGAGCSDCGIQFPILGSTTADPAAESRS
jgi:SAM-dependent methyltransferase